MSLKGMKEKWWDFFCVCGKKIVVQIKEGEKEEKKPLTI